MDDDALTGLEKLLLMSAAIQGFGPSRDSSRANTARVITQVLLWRGIRREEINEAWTAGQFDGHPTIDPVYEVLIRMTHQLARVGPGRPPQRPGPALFEGGGNWGVPGDPSRPACWPLFNSCRLTAHGERLALELLAQHPEFRPSGD
jgi:hypothetical protein